uniref:Putative ribosomal protein S10 n=1 Tax=Barentsia elongata TaxID=478378 RepID=A8UAD2_9BILA|nr:putative ribosomal protein S10 [Barentsia elongata]
MLMPKKDRIAIYEYLFKEGCMVAKKDYFAPKHPDIDVPNLHVVKALQSLTSKGFVKEQFTWKHYYYFLTNEGIQYLREFLSLPPEIVPSTLKRQARPDTSRAKPRTAEGGATPADGGDRREYRRGPPGGDKKDDAGPGAQRSYDFRGGFGRGRPAQPVEN